MVLTGKETLRAQGNKLKVEIWIGKEGISQGTVQTIENSFQTKELIKLKVLDTCPIPKEEVAERLASLTSSQVIQILGNTILFYRPFPEAED